MCKKDHFTNEECEDAKAKLIISATDFSEAEKLAKKYAKNNPEILNELSLLKKMLDTAEENDKPESQELIRIRLCKWRFCVTLLKFKSKLDINIEIHL